MSLLKNRPKCSPAHFLSKLIHNFYRGKLYPKNVGFFFTFLKTVQSKQSPNRRKIAQSGHPGGNSRKNNATHHSSPEILLFARCRFFPLVASLSPINQFVSLSATIWTMYAAS
jgi:hypothetical protein